MALLNLGELDIPEVALFEAVLTWSEIQCLQTDLLPTAKNKRSVMGDVIYAIKYLSMSIPEFAQHVSKSGLFTVSSGISFN